MLCAGSLDARNAFPLTFCLVHGAGNAERVAPVGTALQKHGTQVHAYLVTMPSPPSSFNACTYLSPISERALVRLALRCYMCVF